MTMANDTIKSYSTATKEDKLKVKAGANQFNWNTRGKGAERLKGMIFWWASFDGPKAVPGEYRARLNVNGKTQDRVFTVVPDPRAEASVADMRSQYDFITDINKTIDRAHKSIKKIRAINTQLKSFNEQYSDDERTKELRVKSDTLQKQFGEIEKALYQTKNRSGQDPLNFPIKLTNKLGHLNSLVGMGDFGPTAQDIAVKKQLSVAINSELEKFDALITKEIGTFNAAFNNLKLNYLFIEEE